MLSVPDKYVPPKVPRPMGELHPLPSNERFLKPNKKVPQKVPRPIRKLDPLPSNTRFLEPDEYVPQKVPCPIGRTRPPSTQRTVPSAHSSLHPKQHFDRFIRCRKTHGRDQQTDRETGRPRYCGNNGPHLVLGAATGSSNCAQLARS